jgi:hypothetical protein
VTGLDWTILGFTALLAALGFMRGFIVGALSLAGFAAGAFLGTRLAPALLSGGSASPYAPLFGLFGALIGGAVLTEYVFGWTGMGALFRQALVDVDLNPIMGVFIVTSTTAVVFNLLADLVYAGLDPRIRVAS